MTKIKETLKNIKTSSTLAINELSNQLIKNGKFVYKFGLGQSPFPVPDIIVKELKLNAHQKDYINVSGLLELREAISKYHTQKNKYSYNANNVIIGPGSKELIFQTQLIMDGDVMLTIPSWVSYEPQAKLINKRIHWLNTSPKDDWVLKPEILDETCKKITNTSKLLIFNSPHNPSGTTHNDLKGLASIAKKHNLIIIADEIYAELDFTGEYKSISHYYPEGTIISNGLSKWCGAGGWRLGTFVFPNELNHIKEALRSVASETFTSVSAPIQYAAIKAYTEDHKNYLDSSRKILNYIASYIHKEFTKIGIVCIKPKGGFYMLCDFSNKIKISNEIYNSTSLCKKILNDTGFAMVAGSDFGIDEKLLISRIAFVDFDGKNALKLAKNTNSLSIEFLKNACPNIVNGVNELKKWINKHNM